MYRDEIFVLLGHNGAGKTTTFSMLTGLLPRSGGDVVYLQGKTIQEQMATSRDRVGICPQHSVIWPKLTALEHLVLFARFKGVEVDAKNRGNKSSKADGSVWGRCCRWFFCCSGRKHSSSGSSRTNEEDYERGRSRANEEAGGGLKTPLHPNPNATLADLGTAACSGQSPATDVDHHQTRSILQHNLHDPGHRSAFQSVEEQAMELLKEQCMEHKVGITQRGAQGRNYSKSSAWSTRTVPPPLWTWETVSEETV